jgi:hypothetical protein
MKTRAAVAFVLFCFSAFSIFAQSDSSIEFNVYAFCENPFADSVYVPDLQVQTQSDLVKESRDHFDVKVEKVERESWPNGYYIRTTLTSALFKTVYIGADKPNSKRFRVSLLVTTHDAKLKYHIFIGMNVDSLLQILEPLEPEKKLTPQGESYNVWDDGGVMMAKFVVINKQLSSVELYTSDKDY